MQPNEILPFEGPAILARLPAARLSALPLASQT
jgi:hypothetical protein